MQKFKQWQIVRIKETGDLAMVHYIRVDKSVVVMLQSGIYVSFNHDSLAPVDNTVAESEARSESAFRRAFWCVLVAVFMHIAYAVIVWDENKMRYALGGFIFTLFFAFGYFLFKNTRKPEPPLS